MAKYIDPQEFELIETTALDSETDVIGTDHGLTQDAPQDDRPSVDAPVSFAEAARLLNANESTLRRRWWPRVQQAFEGIEIELLVTVGQTKAGNPIQRLSPLAVELLQSFGTVAGDVQAIEQWQRLQRNLYQCQAAGVDPMAADDQVIDPEIEPAGALAPQEIAVIEVATDWLAETSELVEADWQAVDRQQLNLLDLLNQGGNAIEGALVQIAQQQVAQAAVSYQRTLNQGLAQVLAGNVGKLTNSQPPGDRSSAA